MEAGVLWNYLLFYFAMEGSRGSFAMEAKALFCCFNGRLFHGVSMAIRKMEEGSSSGKWKQDGSSLGKWKQEGSFAMEVGSRKALLQWKQGFYGIIYPSIFFYGFAILQSGRLFCNGRQSGVLWVCYFAIRKALLQWKAQEAL